MMVKPELQGKTFVRLADYLREIEAQLEASGVRAAARNDILAEVKSHLADRVAELQAEGSSDPVGQAIAAFGSPVEIASEFAAMASIGTSARSFSPIRLLSAAWHICRVLGRGFGLFVAAIAGYTVSLGMLMAAALKVIFPARVGFWVGSHGMVWGIPPDGAVSRELAGNWFIPISLWVAMFAGVTTTLLVRARIQRFAASRKRRRV